MAIAPKIFQTIRCAYIFDYFLSSRFGRPGLAKRHPSLLFWICTHANATSCHQTTANPDSIKRYKPGIGTGENRKISRYIYRQYEAFIFLRNSLKMTCLVIKYHIYNNFTTKFVMKCFMNPATSRRKNLATIKLEK